MPSTILEGSSVPDDIVPATAVPSTCSVETQTYQVIVSSVRSFVDAAIKTDDISVPLNIQHDHGYAKLQSQSSVPSPTERGSDHGSLVNVDDTLSLDVAIPILSPSSGDSVYNSEKGSDTDYVMGDDSDSTTDDSSGSNSNGKDRKFVLCEKNLVSLFCTCQTPNCSKPLTSKPTITVTGFAVVVTTECVDGHSFIWHSQPKIGSIYECNLMIPSALFLTGHSYTVYKEICDLIHLCSLSPRQCYNIQRGYILPEIEEMWACHSEAIMSALAGKSVVASGDAICDSPGHNTTFGTYSVMDTDSRLIIAQETVRVTEVKNSYWMEVEGLKRCLDNLSDHGVQITTLATDRHPSIRKTLAEDYNNIKHEYDLWHIVKSVKKKLLSAKKAEVIPWTGAIANHLWYCASACDGDPRLMKEMWISLLHHIRNSHSWTAGSELYQKCNHAMYTPQEVKTTPWLSECTEAFTTIQKVVLDRRLLHDIESVTECVHTGELESLHALFLKYAPKRKKFSHHGPTALGHN